MMSIGMARVMYPAGGGGGGDSRLVYSSKGAADSQVYGSDGSVAPTDGSG